MGSRLTVAVAGAGPNHLASGLQQTETETKRNIHMSTWILWSPDESPESRFPVGFLQGNSMDQYQEGIESEKCPKCGFKVRWISDKYQYENYNQETHQLIANLLKRQSEVGDCPEHPKPNWMV
jgi:hypothetical protein